MDTPLNASANSAGAIFSNNIFEIPRFQREYSWTSEEINDFWADLRGSIDSDSYFLGLIILTNPQDDANGRKQVVDGQQRILTLSLLANVIYHEAIARDRKALADRIRANFLLSIDYETDEQMPRVKLSDESDNATFQTILATGREPPEAINPESVSAKILASHNSLVRALREDLRADPFRRLGKWTEFLTSRLYFAVFIHPDSDAAYQVYEVVNTRGRDLTTADLLKNYVLSQAGQFQLARYEQWQAISKNFPTDGTNNFVQYIRHVVTVRSGYILPKDLFGLLAGRKTSGDRQAPRPNELMTLLEGHLPLYLQIIDPTAAGPASTEALGVFSAFNSLGVITVRPILLACSELDDAQAGMEWILRLVVRRIVTGYLGTGNVERRLGESARAISAARDWRPMTELLADLNPTQEEFTNRLKNRSFNKQVLTFLRRSITQHTITPNPHGFLHFIWTRNPLFRGMTEEEGSFWNATVGNTVILNAEKRSRTVVDWLTFKEQLLVVAADGEWTHQLSQLADWNVEAVESLGAALAEEAGRIWYE